MDGVIAAGDGVFRILAACGVTFVQSTHDSNFICPSLFDF
jgi:hypothetical protein